MVQNGTVNGLLMYVIRLVAITKLNKSMKFQNCRQLFPYKIRGT